jgi:FkbM family methyltransferase
MHQGRVRLEAMLDTIRTVRGVLRSLRIYYGDRTRARAMDRHYRDLIQPGDLVFDIGAHVGDHVAAFRRLGARMIAAEPQPALARVLKLLYGRDRDVAIKQAAVGRAVGTTNLMINVDNPTISTASQPFMRAAQGARGWEGETWSKSISVRVITLDALIREFGWPAFVKIDVEGFEPEVLAGLTQPVAALSFEFTTIQLEVAIGCLERCEALGLVRFNAALGDSQTFVHKQWIDRVSIGRWLLAVHREANSGDVYAIRA